MGQAGENSLYLVDGKPCKIVEQQYITKFFLVHFKFTVETIAFQASQTSQGFFNFWGNKRRRFWLEKRDNQEVIKILE